MDLWRGCRVVEGQRLFGRGLTEGTDIGACVPVVVVQARTGHIRILMTRVGVVPGRRLIQLPLVVAWVVGVGRKVWIIWVSSVARIALWVMQILVGISWNVMWIMVWITLWMSVEWMTWVLMRVLWWKLLTRVWRSEVVWILYVHGGLWGYIVRRL